MALLFTMFSFNFWLGNFQLEYLGTDIFVLIYANGIVNLASAYICKAYDHHIGTKNLVLYSQIIGIVAAIFIILVQ